MIKKIAYKELKGFPGFKVGEDGSILNRRGMSISYLPNEPLARVKVNIDGKSIRINVEEAVYEAFIGVKLQERKIHFKDGDPKNCSVSNITVLDGKFTEIEQEEIDHFTGLACILRKAGLTIQDFFFLNLHKNTNPRDMRNTDAIKWERIIFALVDARRDFIRVELTAKEVEDMLESIMGEDSVTIEELATGKPRDVYVKKSLTRFNFQRTCDREGWKFDDFYEVRDSEDPKNRKKFYVPYEIAKNNK